MTIGTKYPTEERIYDNLKAADDVDKACGTKGKAVMAVGAVIGGLVGLAVPPPGAGVLPEAALGVLVAVGIAAAVGSAKNAMNEEATPLAAEVAPNIV